MTLSQSIEAFVISRLADGYAHVTLAGYRSALGTLVEFLKDPEVQEIKAEDLKAFMHYLHTSYRPEKKSGDLSPLATASFHRYWKALRSFFKWAADDFKLPRPDLDLKMPQYTNREIMPFSQQEIEKLLKCCDTTRVVVDGRRKPYQLKRNHAIRNKALILVLLDTGIRSGECSRLKIRDVNLENGELHVMPYHVRKTRPWTTYLGKSARATSSCLLLRIEYLLFYVNI